MTFNTGNNVPSTSPRDLYDNAENLDKLVNGAEPFYPDRLGKLRESWAGMENSFTNAQEGRETAFGLSQDDKESRFQAFLVSSGYVDIGPYAAGVEFTARNQYVAVDGQFYRPNASVAIPYVATGDWATESESFVLLGDGALRQELAGDGGAGLIGFPDGNSVADILDNSDPAKGAGLVGFMGGTVGQALSDLRGRVATPQQYGAVGDGVADDTAAVQAAIDAGHFTIDGLGGIFRITSQINLRSNLWFRNARIDASGVAVGGTAVAGMGSIVGPFVPAATLSAGGTGLTLSVTDAANFSAGDYLRYRSDDVFDSSNTSSKLGEIAVVKSVDYATGVIQTKTARLSTYSTNQTVEKLVMLSALRLDGVTVTGRDAMQNELTGVRLSYAVGAQISGCIISKADNRAIVLEDCVGCHVQTNELKSARTTGTGYGVSFVDACQDCTATDNYFEDVRHSLSTNNSSARGGIPRRIQFVGNSIYCSAVALGGSMGGGDAIDTHGAAQDITISRNTVLGSSGQGINVECSGAVVSHNVIRNCAGTGIRVHNESDHPGFFTISHNQIMNCVDGVYASSATRGASTQDSGFVIDGNEVRSATGTALRLGGAVGAVMRDMTVSGNVCASAGDHGLSAQNIRGLTISGNTISNPGTAYSCARIINCLQFSITGNTFLAAPSATAAPLLLTASTAGGGSRGIVSGNIVETYTGSTTQSAISVSNNVQYTGIWSNVMRGTDGVALGTGTGNVQANNIV